jgi:acetylornithine/N-succinyldiaminopimelate aminotransferase
MSTYARADIAFTHGEGVWLTAEDGRRFLDFGSGIATCSLGHGHPYLAAAIAAQAGKLMHVSNLYRIPGAERLADRLCAASFAKAAFFCNSGAEANEGMVKMARHTQSARGNAEKYRMICFEGAFHGRTLAMISATGNPKYLAGFGPAVDGFDHVPFNNLNALRDAITPQTAGIFIEPVQGEGGVRPANPDFMLGLREACDEFGLLLCFDEVQCGAGRTGTFLACEQMGVVPDIVSLAKGIAGGFPMGAILASAEVAANMTPGTHASTFGGNPLAAAAANAVLDIILAPGFLQNVAERGAQLRDGLADIAAEIPGVIGEVRGAGLLLGAVCIVANTDVQRACLAENLLTVPAGLNTLRLLPPLIVTEAECAEALSRLRRAVAACAQTAEAVA